MKKILILLLTAFLSSGSLSAQSVDIELLRRTAEQGYMEAQYQLGLLYTKGNSKNLSSYSHNRVSEGVPPDYIRDYDLAIKWLRLAADQDYARAQNLLGLMYDLGRGVPQDYVQAMKWYRLAADQGDASAYSGLGYMYEFGQGVPQDDVQAHMWLNLAAAQGHANGAKNRDLVAKRMTPQQIAQAQELARNWKPKK